MSYEIGRTEPLDEWEWDGVLVGLDFEPYLSCDVCGDHAADYHVLMSCGCSLFICAEAVHLMACLMDRFQLICPECRYIVTSLWHGRPL